MLFWHKKRFPQFFCIYIRITSNDQVWNRPYAKTAVNQAANLLNHDNRSSTYSLSPHQPTATTFQNSISGQGDIPSTYIDPNVYFKRDPRDPPIPSNTRPNLPSNGPLKPELCSMPQTFSCMSPPYPPPAMPHGSAETKEPIYDGNITSYSNMHSQPSSIDPTDSSPPPIPETFIEVLPSEITCPACILQVPYIRVYRIQRSLLLSKFSALKEQKTVNYFHNLLHLTRITCVF